MSGLTLQGFVPKRLEQIILDIEAELRASLGTNLNTGADSIFGQLIGAFAPEVSLVWEALSDLYTSYDPAQATGEALRQIARLNGLWPHPATLATGSIVAQGTSGTLIPIGSRVQNPTTSVIAETTALAQIPVSGVVTIPVRAVEPGRVVSAANGLTQILTPVAGWSSIASSTALEGGEDAESPADLRARIAQSTSVTASVEGAIRARLLAIPEVQSALVLSNRTLVHDANGTPPKSVRAVISPDLSGNAFAEDAIARAIFETEPAGILATGVGLASRTATVVDQQGYTQTVGWEYPTIVPVEYIMAGIFDPSVGPLTVPEAEALALEALEAFTEGLPLGTSVAAADVSCAIRDAVPGFIGLTYLSMNGSPSLLLPILFNEKPVFNSLSTVSLTT